MEFPKFQDLQDSAELQGFTGLCRIPGFTGFCRIAGFYRSFKVSTYWHCNPHPFNIPAQKNFKKYLFFLKKVLTSGDKDAIL
jgi:hypothetical protein